MALPQTDPLLLVPMTGPDMLGSVLWGSSVVSRGPVELDNAIEAWKVGGLCQPDVRHGSVQFLLGDMDRRVVLLRIPNDLSNREIRRCNGSSCSLRLCHDHRRSTGCEEAAYADTSNPADISNEWTICLQSAPQKAREPGALLF